MKKHLAKFENEAAYDIFKAGEDFITPNVSWCVEEDVVKWNPIVPIPPHDYVEIGGIKWATMNIGATAVTDGGLYFQWGDTQGYTAEQCGSGEGQKYFGWADYKYCNGTSNPGATGMTKYNASDGLVTLELGDDAANAAWGGAWRMPTTAELEALGNAVTTTWTSNYEGSGVAGVICTDKADSAKVLFFPALGYCNLGGVYDVGRRGYCWSSSLVSGNAQLGLCMYFFSSYGNSNVNWAFDYYRRCGYAVRGVLGE